MFHWHRSAQSLQSLRNLARCGTTGSPGNEEEHNTYPASKVCLHPEFHTSQSLVIQGWDNSGKISRSRGSSARFPASTRLMSHCVIKGAMLSSSYFLCWILQRQDGDTAFGIASVSESKGRSKKLSVAGSWFPGLLSCYVRSGLFSPRRSGLKLSWY